MDQLLTQVSRGWRPGAHMNEIILPPMSVQKQAGQIAVYGADNLRLVTSIKSDEGKTPTVTMTPTKADAYVLERHALKALASDAESENEDAPFNTQRDKAELTTDLLSVGREIALATFMSDTANITQTVTLSGNDQWDVVHDDSDPIDDINLAVRTVADAMGCADEEVTLILPSSVRRVLVQHATILDLFKYTQTQMVTLAQLAQLFGVKQVLSPSGIYNSAADGQADVIARIWGGNAWAVKIADAKLKTQGFGFTPRRKAALQTDKWYDNDRSGWWVRTQDEFDQYIMNASAAYLIKNAI